MTATPPRSDADRRADSTPGLDPADPSTPELPAPITADEVSVPPPDRTTRAGDGSTDVALTFERS